MKAKVFKKKTTLKLPKNEQVIGGDAPRGSENRKRIAEMGKIVKRVDAKTKKRGGKRK